MASDGAQRQMERKVETVDYRTSAGKCQEYRPIEVVHQPHLPEASAKTTSGSVLTNAAANVVSTLQTAKEAISKK